MEMFHLVKMIKMNGIYQSLLEQTIEQQIYNYQMRMMDGKDMKSIFERWKDKRTQEKRYGGK